jgi:hypothetical protein
MLRIRTQFAIREGLLFRKLDKSENSPTSLQLVLPSGYRKKAIICCHDEMGHPAQERTMGLLTDRFYWPGMLEDVKDFVTKCGRCIRFKAKQQRSELCPLQATHPLELIHLDFVGIESKKEGVKKVNILVVTDHFTRFAQAFILPTQKTLGVAETLWDKYFMIYGLPEKILSDQGGSFTSKLLTALMTISGVRRLRTSPYHPQTNGQCEKFNSTLISMLGTLPPEDKKNWEESLSTLVHCYNCTRNMATGYSPYYLLFGRHPIIPIDLEYGVHIPDLPWGTHAHYANKVRKRMAWAHGKAKEVDDRIKARNKKYYDKKARSTQLLPGDTVLLRRGHYIGKEKIADRWETPLYKVVCQKHPGMPVYDIELADGTKGVSTYHRDRLLPLLQPEIEDKDEEKVSYPLYVEEALTDNHDYDGQMKAALHGQFTCNELIAVPEFDLATERPTGVCTPEESHFWGKDEVQSPEAILAVANQTMNQHFEQVDEPDSASIAHKSSLYLIFWLLMAAVGQMFINYATSQQ